MDVLYNSTDDNLLFLIKEENSEKALEALYKRYWKELYNQAFKRLHIHELCEEIVQDIFIDLWNQRHQRTIQNLQAYLKTTVRYQVFMAYNKSKKLPHFEEPLDHLLATSIQTDGDIFLQELQKAIHSWLLLQPDKRREIFRLRYLEGFSTKEIATELSITQKTVQNQLLTSQEDFRESLSKILLLILITRFF
jgi:RNA polymerase sigma-70 factor (ECF subfamily)